MEDDTIHDEIGCLLKRRRGERGLQYCAFTGLAKANAASNASVVVCCMFERTESGVKREVEKGGDGRFEVVSQRSVAESFPNFFISLPSNITTLFDSTIVGTHLSAAAAKGFEVREGLGSIPRFWLLRSQDAATMGVVECVDVVVATLSARAANLNRRDRM